MVGNVFGKAFRILGLHERKGTVGGYLNKISMEIFRSTLHLFFFYGLLDRIMLVLVWFERSLHSA